MTTKLAKELNEICNLGDLFLKSLKFNLQQFEEMLYDIYIRNKFPISGNLFLNGIKLDAAKLDILCYTIPFRNEFPKHFVINPPVEVRPSQIHGNGVFATRDITVGEFLTFYPGDALICKAKRINLRKVYTPAGLETSSQSCYVRYYSSRYINASHQEESPLESNIKEGYWYDIDDTYAIYGDPSFTDNPWYIGHIINDAIDFRTENSYGSRKHNSYFHNLTSGLGVAIMAKTNIKKDEEILISYGSEYWGL